MVKPKTGKFKNKSFNLGLSDEEYEDHVDASAAEYLYEAADRYHENEERVAAEKLAKLTKRPQRFVREDVLGVATSSDEDEIPTKSKKKKTKKIRLDAEPLSPLENDLEDEKEGDDDEVNLEWGNKRSAYYNADYVDEEWDDGNEKDVEVAQMEEQEALAIQQRMAQQLEEADFGLDFITHLKKAKKEQKSTEEEKIDINLSRLSKREKLKLLTEESPELLELVEDFKSQMAEVKNTLEPLLKLVTENVLPPSPGVQYIKSKYQLILNYCTQIGYYFVLKSKRISIQNHPVVKRLVQFRSLLHQLEQAGSRLQPEIDDLLLKIKKGENISREDFVRAVAPAKKKLRILSNKQNEEKQITPNVIQHEEEPKPKKKRNQSAPLTQAEEDAINFYEAVSRRKNKSKEESSDSDDEELQKDGYKPPDVVANAVVSNEEEETGKRGINYQIAKNKGLTPHRPKEQRNPRVKHRMKFRKAKIRRRGQIREPRKELQKYGGEMSGIKATVVRSVKLK